MEATEEMIARLLEKYCEGGEKWCEMERDLRLLTIETIREYKKLTKGQEPYSPTRKHNL